MGDNDTFWSQHRSIINSNINNDLGGESDPPSVHCANITTSGQTIDAQTQVNRLAALAFVSTPVLVDAFFDLHGGGKTC